MKTELAQFDALKSELTTLVSPTLTIAVTDNLSSAKAIDAGKQVKALQKRIETKRKELVQPLNDRVKEINEYAKTIMTPLEQAEAHIKRQLSAYEIEQEKIRWENLRRAEEERRRVETELRAKHDAEQAAIIDEAEVADLFGAGSDEPSVDERAAEVERRQEQERARLAQEAKAREYEIKQANGVKNARKVWKCEAVDLSIVPKEFLIVQLNTAAVLAAARGGATSIPGVRLWQDTQIALGANTYVPALAAGSREAP